MRFHTYIFFKLTNTLNKKIEKTIDMMFSEELNAIPANLSVSSSLTKGLCQKRLSFIIEKFKILMQTVHLRSPYFSLKTACPENNSDK